MIGIYKITNLINNKVYIGQSVNIAQRWNKHRSSYNNNGLHTYNYPLYQAFRKYGMDNFKFEIIEECQSVDLNQKETYWIKFYHSNTPDFGYNQNLGGDCGTHFVKLNQNTLNEIIDLLCNSKLLLKDIANKYNVSIITIKDINQGHSWYQDNLNYPLRKHVYTCVKCGKEISAGSTYCPQCWAIEQRVCERPTREELKNLVRTQSFESIGRQYGISGKAVSKWCVTYKIPHRKTDINKISDEEWLTI